MLYLFIAPSEVEANVLLYLDAIARILSKGWILIITSVCNTREELSRRACASGCFAVKTELAKEEAERVRRVS
jgi:hypothetical protein